MFAICHYLLEFRFCSLSQCHILVTNINTSVYIGFINEFILDFRLEFQLPLKEIIIFLYKSISNLGFCSIGSKLVPRDELIGTSLE